MVKRLKLIKLVKSSFIIPAFISLLLMYIIFSLSAQSGEVSSELSSGVTEFFVGIIFFDFDSMTEQNQVMIILELQGFVRKAAHFSVYSLLGISVFMTVRSVVKSLKNQLICAFSVCFAYAVFDEIHQLFSDERSGNIIDVLIDVSGSVCGMGLTMLVISVVFYVKWNMRKR